MSEVTLRFQAKDEGLTAQFRRVNAQLDSFGSQVRGISDSIGSSFRAAGIAGVATAAAAAIRSMVDAGLEFADTIQKTRIQTGFTAEEVQKLNLIAGQADVELGAATGAAQKLQKMLGGVEQGSEGASDALAKLNLNNERFRALSPGEQFNEVARALANVSAQNERVYLTSQLFGKGGAELLPVIVAIGHESDELGRKFDLIGGPVGEAVIDKVDKIGDEMATTTVAAKSLATELLAIFQPAVTEAQSGTQTFVGALRYLLFGASTEAGKLEERMNELRDIIDNPVAHGSIFDTERSFQKRISDARKELEQLTRQWNALRGFGTEGIQPPFILPGVNVPQPGDVAFEETDQQRKEREDLESKQIQQRLQHAAQVHQIERDMELQHQLALGEIDQDSLDRSIDRMNQNLSRRAKLQTDYQAFFASVRETFGLEEISFEKIKSQSILEIAASMFGTLAAHNSKLAKIQQGIALAQAIWSTATGITKAFETYGPTPAGFVAAAKVALVGGIQVLKIKSTNYNAGSVSGSAPTLAGGGSISSGAAAQQPNDGQAVVSAGGATTVYISGAVTREVLEQLFAGLREGFDRDVIIIPTNSAQAQAIRG